MFKYDPENRRCAVLRIDGKWVWISEKEAASGPDWLRGYLAGAKAHLRDVSQLPEYPQSSQHPPNC